MINIETEWTFICYFLSCNFNEFISVPTVFFFLSPQSFLCVRSCDLQTATVLFLLFLYPRPVFLFLFFFLGLLGLARISSNMLNRSSKSETILSLFLTWEEKLSVSSHCIHLNGILYVEYLSSVPSLLRVFTMERWLNFVKCCIYWDGLVVSFFILHSDVLHWFSHVEPYLHPR